MIPFADQNPGIFLSSGIDPVDLHTPALAIHMPSVRHNVDRVIDAIGDPSCWRPHLKTTKIPQVWQILVDAGVDRFKCANTLEMSILLSMAPEVDVLLAHHASPAGIRRLSELADACPSARISTLVETIDEVVALPGNVGAFVDVNPGMNRTGIPMKELDRIEQVSLACGEQWRGLHFYEGHIRGGEEDARRERAHASYDTLLRIDANLGGAFELITSGTPTFLHALTHANLVGTMRNTVSPGTVVYHDAISQRMPEIARLGLRPAAAVLAHVVSHPDEHLVTVNAGHKSISADTGDPCCVVMGSARLIPLHPSEEHLPVRVIDGSSPLRGELLTLIPEHVCPTVNLARHAMLLDDEVATTVVRVQAAGHEMPLSSAPV